MFWLEKNLVLSNVLNTGESNFNEKKCQVFNMCSTYVQLNRDAYILELLFTILVLTFIFLTGSASVASPAPSSSLIFLFNVLSAAGLYSWTSGFISCLSNLAAALAVPETYKVECSHFNYHIQKGSFFSNRLFSITEHMQNGLADAWLVIWFLKCFFSQYTYI